MTSFPSSGTLDMLSRLKGIETKTNDPGFFRYPLPLDMLSRLKGIETTGRRSGTVATKKNFGYAFPFEGN